MKTDLDNYLRESGLDGLLVLGPAAHNPAMTYFTGPVHVGFGILALPCGAPGTLYAVDMERDEVARSGFRVGRLDWAAYAREAGGDLHEVMAVALERILRENNLTGRIQVTGLSDAGEALEDFRRLKRRLPGLTIVGFDRGASPFHRARATKDEREVERIRRMGAVTLEVVERVADFLTSHSVRHGLLADRTGRPLTVGDVKQRINLWLMQLGAENPEGTIFALGREAGVPHSAGSSDGPIAVGQPIVFDIFPAEFGGGYFFDFTRTWCVGHAPEPVAAAHAEVVEAYALAMSQARSGSVCRDIQRSVCEFFEERGHPTVLTDPGTRQGYVHSIAHGLGLEVHERPSFRLPDEPPDILEVGHVVTIEPGLYYPERGFGVRVEDTVWIGPDGPQVLASYPFDLVLPLRRSARASKRKAPPAKAAKARSPRRGRRDL